MNLQLAWLLQSALITTIVMCYLYLILTPRQWRRGWFNIKRYYNSLKARLKSTICRFFTGR